MKIKRIDKRMKLKKLILIIFNSRIILRTRIIMKKRMLIPIMKMKKMRI